MIRLMMRSRLSSSPQEPVRSGTAKSSFPTSTRPFASARKKKENWLSELELTQTQNSLKKMTKSIILSLGLLALLGATARTTLAAEAAPAPPKPSVEDRLTDLEAYVTNGARQTNAPTALAT